MRNTAGSDVEESVSKYATMPSEKEEPFRLQRQHGASRQV
jgi:hypothetical protein